MSKVAIVTDSNSGITQKQGQELGVAVVPMPVLIDDKIYFEDVDLTREEFYRRLQSEISLTTSTPSPASVTDTWNAVLKEHDSIVYIPMTSSLSSSCEYAIALAAEYDGKVQVVDNIRISITQRQSVLDALNMATEGMDAISIKKHLEETKLDASIYIMVDTLKYLKRGGRVTAAGAAIGEVLNIKPVLQIQGGKLDAYAKSRGKKAAKQVMIEAIKADIEKRFQSLYDEGRLEICAAYTGVDDCIAEAESWRQQIQGAFPAHNIWMDPLSLSVASHIGPGALAIACCRRYK